MDLFRTLSAMAALSCMDLFRTLSAVAALSCMDLFRTLSAMAALSCMDLFRTLSAMATLSCMDLFKTLSGFFFFFFCCLRGKRASVHDVACDGLAICRVIKVKQRSSTFHVLKIEFNPHYGCKSEQRRPQC